MTGEKEASDSAEPECRPEEADRLYLDILIRRADIQTSQIDGLDAKVSNMFGIASTILPLTLGIYSIGIDNIGKIPQDVACCIFLSIAFYLGSAGVFALGYWPKPWDSRPELKQWGKLNSSKPMQPEVKLHAWLGNSLWDSIKDNKKLIDQKIKLAKWSVFLLVLEVMSLIAVIFVPLV